MHRQLLAGATMVVMGACMFQWDDYDPRAGAPTGGQGGAAGAASSNASSGSGGAGGAVDPCAACTARCGSELSQSFASASPDWSYNGSTTHDDASSSAVLTENVGQSAGTLFYSRPIVLDAFVARFEARITTPLAALNEPAGPNGAAGAGGTGGMGGVGGAGGTGGMPPPPLASPGDGLAFALQTDGPTAVGDSGGALGLVGLSGFVFELDSYDNEVDCGEPAHAHAGIGTLTPCGDLGDEIASGIAASDAISVVDNGWHEVELRVEDGTATLHLDGAMVVGPTDLPGWSPGAAYYVGFGAATGGYVSRHEVRNLTITFPTPRCL